MLSVRHVHKRFGTDIHAVRDVSLEIAAGEVVALLGPSGCGKTTLLRIIAGLEEMDAGAINLEGKDLTRIPIHRRNFGFMFQDFALFPHQTVAENVAFGLRMRNDSRAAIAARVAEMLELVNLPGYGQRTVFELSGGERQRVALARSLAPNPRLLMLDEPLGSLDRNLRESLALELHAILRTIEVTAIYVTHDQQEALVMSDRLAIMNRGQIEQVDTPEIAYRHPATEFVARFLGFRNLIPITGIHDGMLTTGLGSIPIPKDYAQMLNAQTNDRPAENTPRHALLIRPESARFAQGEAQKEAQAAESAIAPSTNASQENPTAAQRRILVRGELVSCVFLGVEYRIAVDVPAFNSRGDNADSTARLRLHFDIPSHQMNLETGVLIPTELPPTGKMIGLYLFPDLMSIIPAS